MGVAKKQQKIGKRNKLSRNIRTEAARRKITLQPVTTEQNRRRKREKHLKLHPNDVCVSCRKQKKLL